MKMPVDKFNEAEKYLIENWRQACLVEKSMKDIRRRYTEIGDRVLESLRDAHKELDWGESCVKKDGYIAAGRKKWRCGDVQGQIGVECISLEELADDNSDRPFIGIWTGSPKTPLTDLKGIERLLSEADTLLSEDELARCEKDDPSQCEDPADYEYQYVIWYYLPEERRALLNMLVAGDGEQFVDCLVGHFKVFAQFIPLLDEIYARAVKK